MRVQVGGDNLLAVLVCPHPSNAATFTLTQQTDWHGNESTVVNGLSKLPCGTAMTPGSVGLPLLV